ncbi:hypothetical protein MBLNU459_g2829t1 [Dothideomycetes sp. NU459]
MSSSDEFKVDPAFVEAREDGSTLEQTDKSTWQRTWPVIACGAGLFSDGYINGVGGTVNFLLKKIYGTKYTHSHASQKFGSIIFAGIVVGQLFFGWTSDHYSRKWSLLASTVVLFIFNALATGAYGANGSASGLFAALAAYRFLTGIGIGGEYPAGSVSCAESTGELKSGVRNRWFIWFTNVAIDIGFVVATLTTMIIILITGENHKSLAWRLIIGLGCIPPLSLIYARWKLQEPEAFKRQNMTKSRTPWALVLKFYWPRLLAVATIWFIYDFCAYGFGYYSSTITDTVAPKGSPLWKVFGWNTVINAFYVPGAVVGSVVADWIGPRKTLVVGVWSQAIVGFIMAGLYSKLSESKNIAAFAVVYGIFLSLGELGPGDNIGLLASKTCATPIRGQYYGVAAATGKIGAYVAVWVFPYIAGSYSLADYQNIFWVSSALAILAGIIAWFFIPEINQDTIDVEDKRFRSYLVENGYDVTLMGM